MSDPTLVHGSSALAVPPAASTRLILLMTDAGGGHRASAQSLAAWAAVMGKPWEISIVNVYREVLGDEEPFKRFTGFYGEEAYNFLFKHEWQAWVPALHRAALLASRFPFRNAWRAGAAFLERERPALSISLMPFVNDHYAVLHAGAQIPFGVVSTDLEDTQPAMWFTRRAMHGAAFVCAGSAKAAEQAWRAGAGGRVRHTGLVIHPRFFSERLRRLTSTEARTQLGLAPRMFTVLVMTGGNGGAAIRELVHHAEAVGGGWQVVACCGHNERLHEQLRAVAPRLVNRVVPLGFSTEVPALMRAADVLVTKPGPATIMEAIAVGVPTVLDDEDTMPQERPNAAWAEAHGFALRVARRANLVDAIRRIQVNAVVGGAMTTAQRAHARTPSGPRIIETIDECLAHAAAPRRITWHGGRASYPPLSPSRVPAHAAAGV